MITHDEETHSYDVVTADGCRYSCCYEPELYDQDIAYKEAVALENGADPDELWMEQ